MKLHLGCGKRYIPGFVHVDLADFPYIDYRQNVRALPMFANDSVELIYASHVMEYFDRIEVTDVLREWRRVLVPGGTMFVAVPDFAALVEVYRKYGDLCLIHGPLYGRWIIQGNEHGCPLYHRTAYDFQSLRSVLEAAGFENVRRYDWRSTMFKDYDDYAQAYIPHMDKDQGILVSLNVQAEKPS